MPPTDVPPTAVPVPRRVPDAGAGGGATNTTARRSLLVQDDGGVRTVILDRPERRNALDTAMLHALLDVLQQVDRDPSIRAVVLTGAGPAFCAGADVDEFRSGDAAAQAARGRRTESLGRLLRLLPALPIPVIAAVNGPAIGAGAALAVAADLTVASAQAVFAYPETRLGIVPALMVESLVRCAGRKAAFQLLALAEPIGAARALEAGLVNAVFPAGELMAQARRLAAVAAALDRDVLSRTKRLIADC